MIQELDTQSPAGFLQLTGYRQVILAGIQIAGWMVMGHNEGGGPVGDRIGENFAWMHQGSVDQADRYGPNGDHLIGTVERNR